MSPHLRDKWVAVVTPSVQTFLDYVHANERLKDKGYVYHQKRRAFETPGETIKYFSPFRPYEWLGYQFSRVIAVGIDDEEIIEDLQSRLEDPVLTKVKVVRFDQ